MTKELGSTTHVIVKSTDPNTRNARSLQNDFYESRQSGLVARTVVYYGMTEINV